MMKNCSPGGNLHTPELFKAAYGNRNWYYYRSILGICISYGFPGPILDIGTGLGLFAECCQRFGIFAVGLEGSAYGLKEGKNRYPELSGVQGLIDHNLPYKNSVFSVVVCYQTIEHLPEPVAEKMLFESYRVLKKEGVLIIYSPCYFDKKQRHAETHIHLYTPSTLRRAVELAGFSILSEPNSLMPIFGGHILGRWLAKGLFAMTHSDRLSATANCICQKKTKHTS